MVEMSSRFTLPPVIRRFGRCGGWEQQTLSPPSSEIGESSQSPEEIYQTEQRYPSCYGGAQTGTERVKSFVSGIVSPFTACWQPSEGLCVPGCTAPDHVFRQQPAVVTPNLDRVVRHRDREDEREHNEYSRHASRRHKTHNPPRRVLKPFDEADADRTNSLAPEKRKRNTDIGKPRTDDILCGRGGSSNRHLGNIHFRELVAANKQIYVGLTKKQKMSVARKIVDAIHNAGGRFLAKDLDTGLFYDIGLPRSLEKTSQALREKHSNEMPVQSVDEGIETSVECHHLVMKNSTNTDELKGTTNDSPAETSSSSKSTTKKLKNTEAPSLIIPSHLMNKFGKNGSTAYEEDLENNNRNALSPGGHHNVDSSYGSPHSLYPSSPYNIPPASTPSHHAYQPVPLHPTVQPGHHHHRPIYSKSPVSSNNKFQSHPQYYYHGQPPHTSSHPQRRHRFHEQYTYAAHDQEVNITDYYSRAIHGARPPAQFRQFRPHHIPSCQQSQPIPHSSPNFHSQGAPQTTRSSYGSHVSSPPMPTYRPSHHIPRNYYRYEKEDSPPSLLQSHDNITSPRILYQTKKNSLVRSNSDVSPIRQKGLKRQRNADGHTNRTSDAMLSTAVENSLSLDERVVGREREKQYQENNSNGEKNSNDVPDLISPSTILQTKSCRRNDISATSGRASPTEKKEDYSRLSGLAALSTAAFLKLDEDEGKIKT